MAEKQTKRHKHSELESLYLDADHVDKSLFAEMRSNVLLVNGEHYTRKSASFFRKVRTTRNLTRQQRLRLTKNHIQNISRIYCNEITSAAPGVGFSPANPSELPDQKAAELNRSVWQDAKRRYRIEELIDDWCEDYVNIGEIAVKLFFDPNGGDIIAHEQKVENGEGIVDDAGNPVPDLDLPVFSGKFVFETIHGFNLLRPSEAKDMRTAEWLGLRKMVNTRELMKQFPEKKDHIESTKDDTFKVFDPGRRGSFRDSLNETMVKEYYFRPSQRFPKGYFYITTGKGILEDGELPAGEFPIKTAFYDKIQTTPRGKSPIKDMRPYQIEINRAASKIAEHQITLGDDKLLVQHGTKTTAGAQLPGLRTVNYTGVAPTILAGRDGSQYLEYLTAQIEELYFVMGVEEMKKDNKQQKMDAYALLFMSAKRKKRFRRNISRFERFLMDIAELYLKLAKVHLPDNMVIHAIGKDEIVNMEEFRNLDDFKSQIIIEAQSDDIETKLGKQLSLTSTLQYASGQLEKEDIGKIIRAMPFVNEEEVFDDVTMDYDTANNIILALDRGEKPEAHPGENHKYMIRRLFSRTMKADFKFLGDEVKEAYEIRLQLHQEMEAQNISKIQALQDGFIPTGGYMVTMDFYAADPKNPDKTKRVKLPYESLLWLIQKLEAQGQDQEQLESMNQGALAQISDQLLQKQSGGVGQNVQQIRGPAIA